MLYTSEQIEKISTEDYLFLTENFRFVDSTSIRECVGYLLYNKRQKLADIVKQAMKNELTSKEYDIAIDYWCNNFTAEEIALKYNLSRSAFFRAVKVIKGKLNSSLKYVLLYSDAIKPPTVENFLELMKTKKIVGERIEN